MSGSQSSGANCDLQARGLANETLQFDIREKVQYLNGVSLQTIIDNTATTLGKISQSASAPKNAT
eukprot:5560382-Amphidinium_carterae.1